MFKKSRGRPLIRAIHNKSLFDSENFSSFAKFAFQNKRPDDNIRTTLILSKNIQLLCYSASSQHSGALTTGGIAVEEQRARRHAVTPFQFGCGTLKCRTGPLLRFPIVAVPERGGKQNQPVSISQIIEAETFQGIGPLPVATAEEYHDCLRLTCGESVCEFDSING